MINPPQNTQRLGDLGGNSYFRYQDATYVKLTTSMEIPFEHDLVLEVSNRVAKILSMDTMVSVIPTSQLDLSLESTNDLIAELFSRFDHGIFSALRVGYPDSERYATTVRWHGNGHTCMGLATDTALTIQQELRQNGIPGTG